MKIQIPTNTMEQEFNNYERRGYQKGLSVNVAHITELKNLLKIAGRELYACQAVIHLAGGFDPAYVNDAQKVLKAIDAAVSLPETIYTSPQALTPITVDALDKLHHIEEFGLFCSFDEFEQIARSH